MNDGTLFDASNLWHLPDSLDDGVCETTSVANKISVVIYRGDTNGPISKKRVLLASGQEEVEVAVYGGCVEVALQHEDVQLLEILS